MVDKGDPLYINVHKILEQKDTDKLGKVYELAISDRNFLKEIMDGLSASNETYRYNCYKALLTMSEEAPLKLYSEWEFFHEMLKSDNAYHQMIGVTILANLTVVDNEEKFDEIFDEYFNLLDGRSLVTARYVAKGAGTVAQVKPVLQEAITKWLLETEKTHHKNRELVVFDAIESLDAYFSEINNKEKVIAFVKRHLKSDSPKTARRAGEFLEKHSK
ncbi:MAG: hypothetical protein JW723_04700 [Bacteroidales bacterium]|nr:hypothetical protein [Bacteroidales bacterium]